MSLNMPASRSRITTRTCPCAQPSVRCLTLELVRPLVPALGLKHAHHVFLLVIAFALVRQQSVHEVCLVQHLEHILVAEVSVEMHDVVEQVGGCTAFPPQVLVSAFGEQARGDCVPVQHTLERLRLRASNRACRATSLCATRMQPAHTVLSAPAILVCDAKQRETKLW